jgi:hypothetical protein
LSEILGEVMYHATLTKPSINGVESYRINVPRKQYKYIRNTLGEEKFAVFLSSQSVVEVSLITELYTFEWAAFVDALKIVCTL